MVTKHIHCEKGLRQPPPGPRHVHGAIQNSKLNGICLPLPVNQSSLALVSSISPKSSSDFDMNQVDIIDETIKQVAQSVNQMLLKTSTGNAISSLTQNDPPHNIVTNIQTIYDSNPSDIHSKQIYSQFIPTNKSHLQTALHIQTQVSNNPNKL